VTANGEWPIVGAALGFPPAVPVPLGDPTGVPLSHCAPVVAHRLQQLYQDTLRHFDQAYASIRSNNLQTSGRVHPPLLQQQPELIPQPAQSIPQQLPPGFSDAPPGGTPQQQLAALSQHAPQPSAQIAQAPSQQPIQPHKIPPLPEDRFKGVFVRFTAATGLRLTDRDLVIEGQPVNLWALHRAVFLRNGFESVRLGMIDGSWL
jgi:hypothetical protein